MKLYKKGDYNIWFTLILIVALFQTGIILESLLIVTFAFALALGWALAIHAKIKK